MSTSSRFVSGTTVRVGQLSAFLASSFIFAWFSGLAEIVSAFLRAPATIIDGFLEWTTRTVGLVFSRPAMVLDAAWASASAFVADLGPVAFLAGVVTVALFFPFASWVFRAWWTVMFDA